MYNTFVETKYNLNPYFANSISKPLGKQNYVTLLFLFAYKCNNYKILLNAVKVIK